MPTVNITDAQIEAARAAGRASLEKEAHAESAWYEAEKDLIWVKTTRGVYHGVPAELLQGVKGATPEQKADIEMSPLGVGLHWPQLDADLTVQGLLFGLYGTKPWMAELGKKGGQQTSEKKAAAARANGKKGGRPRKRMTTTETVLRVAEEPGEYRTE